MPSFQLFKISVYPSEQRELFGQMEPHEILKEALKTPRSDEEGRRGGVWHIANMEELDEGHGLYFRIGRTIMGTRSVFRDDSFEDMDFDVAPYTHAILDVPNEICAIARKPGAALPAKLSTIATVHLNRLLALSPVARSHGVSFKILALDDPDSFIMALDSADRIARFSLHFRRSNPGNMEGRISDPLEKVLRELEAERGSIVLDGESLSATRCKELAHDAASTGEKAYALVVVGGRKVAKHLRGDPAVIEQDEVGDREQMHQLLERLRRRYAEIRETDRESE